MGKSFWSIIQVVLRLQTLVQQLFKVRMMVPGVLAVAGSLWSQQAKVLYLGFSNISQSHWGSQQEVRSELCEVLA